MARIFTRAYVPLAQLDRASGYGPEGWGFKSSTARQTHIIRTLRRFVQLAKRSDLF